MREFDDICTVRASCLDRAETVQQNACGKRGDKCTVRKPSTHRAPTVQRPCGSRHTPCAHCDAETIEWGWHPDADGTWQG